jgi:hypothetical protein
MLRTFAVTLLTIFLLAGAANAHGGGGAEPMPLTNFTDLPRYCPADPPRRIMPVHKSTRPRQSSRSAHNH